MNAVLYTRVSTLQQVDKDSLKHQESMLKAYCKAHSVKIVKHCKDAGFSAKKDNFRPALKEVIDLVQIGKVELVLVSKIDRISRSLKDLLDLIYLFHEHDVSFVAVSQNIDTSGYMGRFTLNLLGAIAELEREMTAERVSEVMKHRAVNGKWNGGVIPYGYTTQQRIIKELTSKGLSKSEAVEKASEIAPEPKLLYIDEDEANVLKQIFELYLKVKSIRDVVRQLNKLGIKTRPGKNWSTTSISRILNNPTYIGKLKYGVRKTDPKTGKMKKADENELTLVDGLHEKLIDNNTFELVQKILNETSLKKTNAQNQYLLSRILKCGKCGGSMNGHLTKKKKSDKTYIYYKCSNHSKIPSQCEGLTISADRLEAFIVKTLTNLSKDQIFLNDKAKMLEALEKEIKPAKNNNARLKKITAKEKDLLKRRDKLLDALENDLIDDSVFKERFDNIKLELENNNKAKEEITNFADDIQITKEILNASFEEISSFGQNWEYLDFDGKYAKIRSIVKQIKVTEDDISIEIYLDGDPKQPDVDVVSRTGMGS